MSEFIIDTWSYHAHVPIPTSLEGDEIREWIINIGKLGIEQISILNRSKVYHSDRISARYCIIWSVLVKINEMTELSCEITTEESSLSASSLWVDMNQVDTNQIVLTRGVHQIAIIMESDTITTDQPRLRIVTTHDKMVKITISKEDDLYLDLDNIHYTVDLLEGDISYDSKHIIFVSNHWDIIEDKFVKKMHVCSVSADGSKVRKISSSYRENVRTTRFSPDGRYIAFLQSNSDSGMDQIVVYEVATGESKILVDDLSDASYLVWSRAADGIFFTCDKIPPGEKTLLHIEDIPARLPWHWNQKQIRYVSFIGMQHNLGLIASISSGVTEPAHLCLSMDGNILAFVEERVKNDSYMVLYLNCLDLIDQSKRSTFRLPNSFVNNLVFSPSSRYIAYIGSRFSGYLGSSMCLDDLSDSDFRRNGYQVNVYDTRVYVIDLQEQNIIQLGDDLSFSAGVPVGISSLNQEIYWNSEEIISYIATKGNQTIIVKQNIHDNGSISWQDIGSGSSRGHSFAANGTCFFFHSHRGEPLVPCLLLSSGRLNLFAQTLEDSLHQCLRWHTSQPVPGIVEGRAWIYFPEEISVDSEGSIPLIVCVYGGASPLCLTFDDTHQVLTSRGYAVLILNPQGCSGFGSHSSDLHVNDWGKIVVPEIIDMIKVVLDEYRSIDSTRVGIYGGSYGGFLAMMLIAHSTLFKAACSIAGISNIASYWGGSRFGYQYGLSALSGSFPWSSPELFVQQSPLFMANRITTPLLLLHGESDPIVPVSESEQIFISLKMLGREAVLIIFGNEEHGLRSCPSVRRNSRQYLVSWFDKHLKSIPTEWDRLRDQQTMYLRR